MLNPLIPQLYIDSFGEPPPPACHHSLWMPPRNHIGKWGYCECSNNLESKCLTTEKGDGPKKNTQCKFPFKVSGVLYNTCTTAQDPNGKYWCSTKTDNKDRHMRGQWGYCDERNCPLE